MSIKTKKTRSITRFAWLSISAAVLTILLKITAYLLTNSVGLLSDAMESFINLAGATMALAMLRIAVRPADEDHAFGHSKAEYFSSGVEGLLIFIAAISIGIISVERFINPKKLEQVGIGMVVSVVASLINLFVAIILIKAGKRYNSITLEADAKHLITDVWTTGGVLVGVGAVALTGWVRLDPVIAFLVSVNIVWSGISIIRKSVFGLMDKALPIEEQNRIKEILETYTTENIQFHAILTRRAGARQFVSFHVLVPGYWTVNQGHQLLEAIETELRDTFPYIVVSTHLEPLEDPSAYNDVRLDRID